MPVSDYTWPKYPTGPKDHLYALGVISLNFNLYEYSLTVFLERYLTKDVAGFLFDKLTNFERAAIIRLLMKVEPEEVIEDIEYLLRHFATCAQNRHNLLHSRLALGGGTLLIDVLAIEKFARGNPEKILEFHLETGDLHRTADEMYAGFEFVLGLFHYFRKRDQYHILAADAQEGLCPAPLPSEHPALPKRPPEPRAISPLLPS
jgi:hypothetical protein